MGLVGGVVLKGVRRKKSSLINGDGDSFKFYWPFALVAQNEPPPLLFVAAHAPLLETRWMN